MKEFPSCSIALDRKTMALVESAEICRVSGVLMTLLHRHRFQRMRQEEAACTIQRVARRVLSRKAAYKASVRRLQNLVISQWQRIRAARFIEMLARRHGAMVSVTDVSAIVVTCAWRSKLRAYQLLHAALRLQAWFRKRQLRRSWPGSRHMVAASLLRSACARFAAARKLSILRARDAEREACSTWRLHAHVALMRVRFAMRVREGWGRAMLQRCARGYLARRRVRLLRWHCDARAAVRRIRVAFQVYNARAAIAVLQGIARQQEGLLRFEFVVRRYHWRIVEAWLAGGRSRGEAQVKIAAWWRGRLARLYDPEVSYARWAVQGLRDEYEYLDALRLEECATKVQACWRSFAAWRSEGMARLVGRYGRARRAALETEAAEIALLPKLASRPLAACGGAMVAHISPTQSPARPALRGSLLSALVECQDAGGPVMRVALSPEGGVAVTASGMAFRLMEAPRGPHSQPVSSEPEDPSETLGWTSRKLEFDAIHGGTLRPQGCILPLPCVVNVSCGLDHSLFLSEEGLLFSFGSNRHGQCGISRGIDTPDDLEQLYCVQSWASQLVPKQEMPSALSVASGTGGLAKVTTIACGHNHSAVIDCFGLLWLWGERDGVGLRRLCPSSDGGGDPAPFLLFHAARDGFNGGASGTEAGASQNFAAESGLLASTGPLSMDPCACADIHELSGNVLMPTLCKALALVSAQSDHGKWSPMGSSMVRATAPGVRAVLLPARGRVACTGPFNGQNGFTSIAAGGRANFAISERRHLFLWGDSSDALLACRGFASIGGAAAPRRDCLATQLPAFKQININVHAVALGKEHVAVMTGHGKVYTWGHLEVNVRSTTKTLAVFDKSHCSRALVIARDGAQVRRSPSVGDACASDALLGVAFGDAPLDCCHGRAYFEVRVDEAAADASESFSLGVALARLPRGGCNVSASAVPMSWTFDRDAGGGQLGALSVGDRAGLYVTEDGSARLCVNGKVVAAVQSGAVPVGMPLHAFVGLGGPVGAVSLCHDASPPRLYGLPVARFADARRARLLRSICPGPRGFGRHVLAEPHLVDGALRSLYVTHVAAGYSSTAAAVEGRDTLLGWDMLEFSAQRANILSPCVYDHLFSTSSWAVRAGISGEHRRIVFERSATTEVLLIEQGGALGKGTTGRAEAPQHAKGRAGHVPSAAQGTRSAASAAQRSDGGKTDDGLFQWASSLSSREPHVQQVDVAASVRPSGHAARRAAAGRGASWGSPVLDLCELERELVEFQHLSRGCGLNTAAPMRRDPR